MPYIDIICDDDLEAQPKIKTMQHIASQAHKIFLPQSAKMCEDFENLIDCLIFHILAYSEFEQKEEGKQNVSRLQQLQQVSNSAFDLLTFLVGQTPFCHEPVPTPTSSIASAQGLQKQLNTAVYFDKISAKEAPMTVREKLVWAVLQTYSPLVPHQNQTFVNSKAE